MARERGGSSPSLPARPRSPSWLRSSTIYHRLGSPSPARGYSSHWVLEIARPFSFASSGQRKIKASAVVSFQGLHHLVLILLTPPTVWVKG